MQRIALVVQLPAELAIRDTALDRDRAVLAVDPDHAIEMLERDQILRCVRNAIEEVARAEHAQFVLAAHRLLHLRDRFRGVQPGGAVGQITGPIADAHSSWCSS
jgi:hypothetical protein